MSKLAKPKERIDINNPKPFRRMQGGFCNRSECTAQALFRIGGLDVCGRHTTWAIEYQLKEGEVWEKGLYLARYIKN